MHYVDGSPQKVYIDVALLQQSVRDIVIINHHLATLKEELHKQIIGMDEFINAIIISMLCGGHALVEGVPGLAKTKTIHIFATLL